MGAGGRGERAAGHRHALQREAGDFHRHRHAAAADQPGGVLAVPGRSVDHPAGDRIRGAVRRGRGGPARPAHRADPDHLEARLPAAARRGAVLPDHRHPSGLRPGDRDPLVRDARRRADETSRGGADAQRPALLLHPDHGHHRPGAALGAQDHDDRARHGRGVHLPQAVPAPVLLGRLRHARRGGARQRELARVHLRLPPGDRGGGGRRGAGDGPVPRGPLGAPRHGGGRDGRRHGGGRRRGRRDRRHGSRGDIRCARRGQPHQRQAVAGRGVGTGRTAPPLPLPNGAPPVGSASARRAGRAAASPGPAPGPAGPRSRRSAAAGRARRLRSARARHREARGRVVQHAPVPANLPTGRPGERDSPPRHRSGRARADGPSSEGRAWT